MLREVLRFELRYQLGQPVFWLASVVFFLLTFGAVTSDVVMIGGAIGNVNRNAPFVIAQILLVMSILGVFVSTAFVASAVLRDHEHRTAPLFFSTPLTKRDYLLGRFGGSMAAAVLVFVPVAGAIVVGSWMPWLEPERVGPFMAEPYLASMLLLVVPNLFLMGAVFFGLATATRSLMWTYVGLVAFFVGYAVAATLLSDLENEGLAALLDPFGAAAFGLTTKYWTTVERNTQVLGLDGPLVLNRLVWTGVALAALALTYARFSFTVRETAGKRRRRWWRRAVKEDETAAGVPAPPPHLAATAAPARDFSRRTARIQLLHQARHETATVVRSLPFLVIAALGVLNLVGASIGLDQFFGTPVYPVTHLMITLVQGAFLLFLVIVLTFYSGELVFHERQQRMDEVQDALPVPDRVQWGAKLAALLVVVLLLLLVAVVTSVAIQAFHGYTRFELGLYARGLLLGVGVPFAYVAVLALTVQVLTNHKYAGYLIMVLYYVSLPVLSALDFDHNLYKYASTPAAPYSDMNGFGHFTQAQAWFHAYWGAAAIVLLCLVHVFWVRGKETAPRTRLALARQRLTRPVGGVMAGAGLAFVASGGWIFYNTNVLNEYVPGDVARERQARYERDYKRYEGIPQPRIAAAYAEVDLFPEERSVDIRGRYRLVNRSSEPVETLHVLVPREVEVEALAIPGATPEHEDPELGYAIHRLAEPLAPGGELEMRFDLAVRNRGFVNHGDNLSVVHNGTFFNNLQYFPHIGYSRAVELQDPNRRRKHGLPPIQRLPPLEDSSALGRNYLTGQSDWLELETVVSTSPDQVALAPGYLEREWEEGGRRYFHYRMDAPILGFWSYLSARWEVRRDRWNDVEIAVYHHPAHDYNVDRMIDAVKKSLDYFTRAFGPYQHRQVRIVEFPRYARFAQSFPNTIPFSESIGFIARLEDPEEIDYVFYVTAHEVAHQWWAHQVIGAWQQGATVTSETMAQYSALMVQEGEYGPHMMRRFLKYELDNYLRGRGGERIEELPLLRVENQPYIHYNKGSLVMYALRDHVGEDPLNAALADYVEDVGFSGPPYTTSPEFLSYVARAVPEERASILEDLFETITLYDLRAPEVTAEPRDGGRWTVRLSVEARKVRVDGAGAETEIPLDDWIDVGVFGAREDGSPPEGKVLLLEKRRLAEGERVFELVVDEEPVRAGIDPFNKLIDRNPEDNLATVSAARRPSGE